MTAESIPLLLDAVRAHFVTHHVSILVGSCSAEGEPSVVRAYGCRVAAERCSVTVFLAVEQSAAVLRDIRSGGAVAAVFSRPTTHETLQLKGARAAVVPLEVGDRELMRAYGQSFCDEIGTLGYDDSFGSAIMVGVNEDAVGIVFIPTAAFEQTPGPSAGRPLHSPA